MSALDNTTPENRNFLSPLNFRFQIKKAPNVNFFVQKVNLAPISIKPAITSNPFVNISFPGEHVDYDLLNITFKVDEDLQNYLEIHNWLKALGKPKDFQEYFDIANNPSFSGEGIYSDISLTVLTSDKAPNYETIYVDSFPISLSGLVFNTTDTDVNYLEASASFKYTYYDINKI